MNLKIRLRTYKIEHDEIDSRKYVLYQFDVSKSKQIIDLWMDENDDEIITFVESIQKVTKENNFCVLYSNYKYEYKNGKIKKRKMWNK